MSINRVILTGNLTRDHAFCTVYIGGRKIDVGAHYRGGNGT